MKPKATVQKPYVEWVSTRDVDGVESFSIRRTPVAKAIARAKKAARAAGNSSFSNDNAALQWFIQSKPGGKLIQ